MGLNEAFNIEINNNVYRVKIVEDMHGPKRIVVPKTWGEGKNNGVLESSLDKEHARGVATRKKKVYKVSFSITIWVRAVKRHEEVWKYGKDNGDIQW